MQDLQALIETIPTMESAQELSDGLSRLDVLAERAGTQVGLRRALGYRGSSFPKAPRRLSYDRINQRVRQLQNEIDGMETLQVIQTFEQSTEPLPVLIELANPTRYANPEQRT